MRGKILALAPMAVAMMALPASAESISLASGTASMSQSVSGHTIDLTFSDVRSNDTLIVRLDDLKNGRYRVVTHLTNDSGVDWTSLDAAILTAGAAGAAAVPLGSAFSVSGNSDGLSFAGHVNGRSNVFADVFAEEAGGLRDFIQFSGGTISGASGTGFVTFKLRNGVGSGPFFLAFGPNGISAASTPEPASLMLISTGLLGVFGAARRSTKKRL